MLQMKILATTAAATAVETATKTAAAATIYYNATVKTQASDGREAVLFILFLCAFFL